MAKNSEQIGAFGYFKLLLIALIFYFAHNYRNYGSILGRNQDTGKLSPEMCVEALKSRSDVEKAEISSFENDTIYVTLKREIVLKGSEEKTLYGYDIEPMFQSYVSSFSFPNCNSDVKKVGFFMLPRYSRSINRK